MEVMRIDLVQASFCKQYWLGLAGVLEMGRGRKKGILPPRVLTRAARRMELSFPETEDCRVL